MDPRLALLGARSVPERKEGVAWSQGPEERSGTLHCRPSRVSVLNMLAVSQEES